MFRYLVMTGYVKRYLLIIKLYVQAFKSVLTFASSYGHALVGLDEL